MRLFRLKAGGKGINVDTPRKAGGLLQRPVSHCLRCCSLPSNLRFYLRRPVASLPPLFPSYGRVSSTIVIVGRVRLGAGGSGVGSAGASARLWRGREIMDVQGCDSRRWQTPIRNTRLGVLVEEVLHSCRCRRISRGTLVRHFATVSDQLDYQECIRGSRITPFPRAE